jgi:hypothetical protein
VVPGAVSYKLRWLIGMNAKEVKRTSFLVLPAEVWPMYSFKRGVLSNQVS